MAYSEGQDQFTHLQPLLSLFPLPYSLLLPTIDDFTARAGIDVFPAGEKGREVRSMVEGWLRELIKTENEEMSWEEGEGKEGGGMEEDVFRQMLTLLTPKLVSPPDSTSPSRPSNSPNKTGPVPPSSFQEPIICKIRRNSNSGRIRSESDTSETSSGSGDEPGSAFDASLGDGEAQDNLAGAGTGSVGSRESREADEAEDELSPDADDSGFAKNDFSRRKDRQTSFPTTGSPRSRTNSVGQVDDTRTGSATGIQRRRRVRSNRSDGAAVSAPGNGSSQRNLRTPPPPLPPTPKGPFSNRVGLSFPLSSPTRAGHDLGGHHAQTPPSAFSMGLSLGRKYTTSDPSKGAARGVRAGSGIVETTKRSRGHSNAGSRSRVPSDSSEWAASALRGGRTDGDIGDWDESTPVKRGDAGRAGKGAPPSSFAMVYAEGGESERGARRNSVASDRVAISPAAEMSSFLGDRSTSNPIITRPKPPHRSTRRQSSGPGAQALASPTSPETSFQPFLENNGLISPSPSAPAFFGASHPQPLQRTATDGLRSPDVDSGSLVTGGVQGWQSPGGRAPGTDSTGDELDGWGRDRREERYSRMASSSDESFKQEYEELQRENTELKRKKEALEKALVDTKSELENEMARLQGEIDETHVHLKEKKMEDGENTKRMAERLEHIKSLEANVIRLHDRLNAASKTREADQRNLNALIAEKSVLRAEIDDHKHKVAELEESEQNLLTEKNVTAVQMQSLARVNEELLGYQLEAERIARELDNQKQVNHQLKDEISRLEGTLKDARTRHVRDGTSTSGVGPIGSEPGTASRSLGAEMLRSAFEQEDTGSDRPLASPSEEGSRPMSRARERTILRTTIHYRPTPTTSQVASPAEGEISPSASTFEHDDTTEEQILEVSYTDAATATVEVDRLDASAQTDDSMLGSLPPYSRHEEAEPSDSLSHPRMLSAVRAGDLSPDQHEALQRAYTEVSSSLGTRCTEIELELQRVQKEYLSVVASGAQVGSSSVGTSHRVHKHAKVIKSTDNALLSPYILVPSCLILAGAIGYMIGVDHGSVTLSKLDELLLLRDIAALTSGAAGAGFGYAGMGHGGGNNFLAGTYVMKAVGGGGRMATGRVPL